MAGSKQARLVAVVEDDAGLRAAIVNLLESVGLAARGFGSAERFLRSRAITRAACLILDIQLPGLSGLDLCERLRTQGSAVPIVLITASEDARVRTRSRTLSDEGRALLRKPFTEGEFLRAIRRALGARGPRSFRARTSNASKPRAVGAGVARRRKRTRQKPRTRS